MVVLPAFLLGLFSDKIVAGGQDERMAARQVSMNDGEVSDTVFLLHGLFNRPFMMGKIARALQREGYDVVNWGYPSRKKFVEDFAADLDVAVKKIPRDRKIHFVGFSLGAVIARYYLSHYNVPNAGRFVMIAPPNRGSEKAEKMYRHFWFRGLYGKKSVTQMFPSNKKFFEECGVPPVEFGVIVGGKGNNRGYSRIFGGDNDGTVSVESARLPGARDFIQVRGQHTMLLFSRTTSGNVRRFLKKGSFEGITP